MKDKVKKEIPFIKVDTTVEEALTYFREIKREDKIKTLFYDKNSFVTLYKFDGVYNYMLGNLPHDSSILKYFDLTLLKGKGIILRYPTIYDDGKITKYKHHEQFFNNIDEYLKEFRFDDWWITHSLLKFRKTNGLRFIIRYRGSIRLSFFSCFFFN